MPDEPEVQGLVTLMELHASRFAAPPARRAIRPDQDRSRWNWSLIRRGLDGLKLEQIPGKA
jgi:predicted RNA polymerase sigma factor